MAARLLFFVAATFLAACGGGVNILPEPFTRERADGKIPVKTELIRQQVRAELGGMPEGEAEVARWQKIETDYNDCRLSSGKAKSAKEQVFANCMSKLGYVYMYPLDAEQLHNDIEFEIEKEHNNRLAAERKAEEERIAAERKAEEERIAAEERRQAEEEYRLWQNKLNSALIAAVRSGDTAEEARLIEEGANPQVAEDEYNRIFAEHEAEEKRIAAEKKRREEQERIRRQKALDDALIVAAKGNVAEVNRLIDGGANVNAKSNDGNTPLLIAVKKGRTESGLIIIHALIKAGADVNAKNNNGETPLFIVVGTGRAEAVTALIKAGADIDAKSNKKSTPLFRATGYGYTKIAHALINAGVDINTKHLYGFRALHLAAQKGRVEILHALIKAGAYIDATNDYGVTPLYSAAHQGQTETLLALIHAGAYLKAMTNDGETPLDVARRRKQWGIVKILENLPPPRPSGEAEANVATALAPEDNNIAEQVFTNAWRSVVYIESNDSQGGGVIIKPNIVVTNCHVVDSGNIIVYKSKNRRTDKSKQYRATIRHRDTKRDFCLLDVSGLLGFTADVRRYDTLRIGESVYGIGSPRGLDLSLTSGLISQKRIVAGVRKIQTDTAISPGSSGGGLFDRKGNLIGIMTSKIVDEEAEGLGFAIPADLAL